MRLDARILLVAAIFLYFLESAAFVARPFFIPDPIVGILYPQFATLNSYCSQNSCLYDPQAVASLYTVQLLSFLALWVALYLLGKKNKYSLDSSVAAVCAVVVCGSLVDYLIGNFSFDPKWILPNSVTISQLGVFRFAVMFSIASTAVAILTNIVKPKEA